MKALALGEKEFCEVFSFMGVDILEIKDKQQILPVLEKYLDKDYLILLSYTFYKEFKQDIEEMKIKAPKAVILELPALEGEVEEEFDIKKVLQTVSGVKI